MLAILLFLCGGMTMPMPVPDPVIWSFKAVPSGKSYRLQLIAEVHPGWHLYAGSQPTGAIALPTQIQFNQNPLITYTGATVETGNQHNESDPDLGTPVRYYTGTVFFSRQLAVKKGMRTNVTGTITYQVCSDEKCLPPKTIPFSVQLP